MSIPRRFRSAILALLWLATLPGASSYAQNYTFTDLGGLPGLSFEQSEPRAINDAGEIVGSSYTAGVVEHGVVWAKDATGRYVITDLRTRAYATGINNHGDVIAGGLLIMPVSMNGNLVWYQDLDGDGVNDLAIPLQVGARAINDVPQLVGSNDIVQFDASGKEIDSALDGDLYAINDDGLVAGETGSTSQATIWQIDSAGKVQNIVTLSPLGGKFSSSVAACIDASGPAAAGSSYSVNEKSPGVFTVSSRATLWQNGTAPTDLGAPIGPSSWANGIRTVNGVLQVVGGIGGNLGKAFLWKNGALKDLNTLISVKGVTLTDATAINSHGQIVGTARVTVGKNNTELHGFLLTPK
jgi:hypothetical protein